VADPAADAVVAPGFNLFNMRSYLLQDAPVLTDSFILKILLRAGRHKKPCSLAKQSCLCGKDAAVLLSCHGMSAQKAPRNVISEYRAGAVQDFLLGAADVRDKRFGRCNGTNPLNQVDNGPHRSGEQYQVAAADCLGWIFGPGIYSAHLARALQDMSAVAADNPRLDACSLQSQAKRAPQ
jgi:hypothetical protein